MSNSYTSASRRGSLESCLLLCLIGFLPSSTHPDPAYRPLQAPSPSTPMPPLSAHSPPLLPPAHSPLLPRRRRRPLLPADSALSHAVVLGHVPPSPRPGALPPGPFFFAPHLIGHPERSEGSAVRWRRHCRPNEQQIPRFARDDKSSTLSRP